MEIKDGYGFLGIGWNRLTRLVGWLEDVAFFKMTGCKKTNEGRIKGSPGDCLE